MSKPTTAALAPGSKRQSMLVQSTPGSPEISKVDSAAAATDTTTGGAGTITAKNVASPGELCGFVDTLLNTLESRFDEMSDQVLSRMNEMSGRIDNLETAISDLMNSGADSPTATPTKTKK